jgi:hypothetical protein
MRRLLFTVLLLGAAARPAFAHDAAERAALGEKFMAREEWFRAATAFEEAALETTGAASQAAWIRAADAHRMARQFAKAAALYQEAASAAAEQGDLAALRAGQSLYLAKKYAPAAGALTVFSWRYPESRHRDEAAAFAALASLGMNDLAAARARYSELADAATSPARKAAWAGLAQAAAAVNELPQKSLRLAAALSLVPGLGQVYTEHYGEAGMAFVVNAVFGAIVWDQLLKAKDLNAQPHRGWAYTSPAVIGFVALPFYLGNIYGAGVSAQRYNRLQYDGFRAKLKDRTVRLQLLEVPLD